MQKSQSLRIILTTLVVATACGALGLGGNHQLRAKTSAPLNGFMLSNTQAQNLSAQSGIRARGRGSKLILTFQGKNHSLDVRDSIGAAKLQEASVLFVTRRPDFTYLVVSACGPSKEKSDDRQCGAGEECNLLWIKLGSRWEMSDIKSVLYESCWLPVNSMDGYKISGNTLTLEYDDLRKGVNARLTYDAERAESGLLVEESPIK
ncbi:MAG TPA: hypothetical protein VF735_06440 [Pyrinomonadaceae bacterium]|jgi:hypothetical protein